MLRTGSYHEYQDDSLDDIIMSEELKKAFAKERKKAREKEDKAMLVRALHFSSEPIPIASYSPLPLTLTRWPESVSSPT